jgi:hypothetical protein
MLDVVDEIAKKFKADGLVGDTWADKVRLRGRLVALYRRYYEGDHRLNLSKEMKAMLQIKDGKFMEHSDRYNDNYCEMVVDTLSDRLTLDGIEAESPAVRNPQENGAGPSTAETTQAWADAISRNNRLDGLQIRVHEAALRDGETFVMSEWSDLSMRIVFSHEPTWDGDTGVIAVYDRRGEMIAAAAKVWLEADVRHVNLYYAGRVEKYVAKESGDLERITRPEMVLDDGAVMEGNESTVRDGQIPGLPLVAFRNRGGGRSELVNVIPLQDSLNSTLVSMVMSALLTAFAILFARGWKPPATITPGMLLHAMVEGEDGKPIVTDDPEAARAYATLNQAYDLKRIEGGNLKELHDQADFLIEQISAVSSTPTPGKMGGAASGEALKQLDVRLVGKARRAHAQIGNAWEDLYKLAHRQQTIFATKLPPAVLDWRAKWETAEIRDDANIRELAKLLSEMGYEREALRALNHLSLLDFSEERIDQMMQDKAKDSALALAQLGGNLPGFENFAETA